MPTTITGTDISTKEIDVDIASSSASILFKTGSGNPERARIDASGRLLHGTTSTTGVAGTGASIRSGVVSSATAAALNLDGSGSDFYAVRFGSSGTTLIDIVSGGTPRVEFRNSAGSPICRFLENQNVQVEGSLSKGSGSFKIDHPLPEKSETHHLVHSFVESPLADNIYRGITTLTDGTAQINIDTYVGMTEGTFSALNGNPQIFLQNESGFEPVKGHVVDNILYIQCRDETSTDTISWMVVAERQDQHMLDTEWTDEFGRPVLEPEKNPEPDEEFDSDGEVI